MARDLSDIYIKGVKDPNFVEDKLENQTFIDTVISKIYMILMTNKGDVLGDENFGADIPKYLWRTKFPSSTIQNEITDQIAVYVPELNPRDYKVNVYILPGKTQDVGVIEVSLGVASAVVLYK
jgi:hypothetical protein